MTRKFKKVLITVAAAAMTLAAMAIGADANYNGYKDGTYTVTANLYVPQDEAPLNLWDAYFTSTKIPPNEAVSENATLVVNSEGLFLTVPVNNSGLAMTRLGTMDTGITPVEAGCTTAAVDCDTSGHEGTRYTTLEFKLTPDTYSDTLSYTLQNCESHAKITKTILGSIEITATDKELTTSVIVDISGLSNAQA